MFDEETVNSIVPAAFTLVLFVNLYSNLISELVFCSPELPVGGFCSLVTRI